MELTPYILIALATYRAARMVALEDGPFEVFAGLREAAARRFVGRELAPGMVEDHWVVKGVNCPLCVGFWVAPAMFLLWYLLPGAVAVLAVAGAAAWLQRREDA